MRPLGGILAVLLAPLAAAQGGGLEIEDFPQAERTDGGIPGLEAPALASSEQWPQVRVHATVRSQVGVDTSFDSRHGDPLAENVWDLRSRAWLGIDARLSGALRIFGQTRAWWRVTSERAFERSKGLFELEPGEAFVDVYSKWVDLRVGNQVVAFGANPLFAPSDVLNPRDFRESFILGEPQDLKRPHFGVRALGTTGPLTWTLAYFPFFQPHRYTVTGQDEAILQPALGIALPREVHESIEDQLQPHLLETERPKAFPWLGDVGVRATTGVGPATVGLSWVWAWEKFPRVELSPELATLLRSTVRGDPDPTVAGALRERLVAGGTPFRGSYPRRHLFSAEAQVLVSSFQLDVDLAWSPGQTLYASDLRPIRRSTLTWVVGVSQAADSKLLYNVTYVGIAVPGLPSEEFLFLLESGDAAGAPRTLSFHALFATLGYRLLDDRLELSVRAAMEPIQRSWVLAPRVAWRGFERVTLAVGAELYEGRVYSPFGYFDRNDQVVAQVGVDLF